MEFAYKKERITHLPSSFFSDMKQRDSLHYDTDSDVLVNDDRRQQVICLYIHFMGSYMLEPKSSFLKINPQYLRCAHHMVTIIPSVKKIMIMMEAGDGLL